MDILGVGATQVTVISNSSFDHVTVVPPARPGGPYAVHFTQTASAEAITQALHRHRALAARRPADRSKPLLDGPRGGKVRWTGTDEAAYLGRPLAVGDDHWQLAADGALRYQRGDAGVAHPVRYNEVTGRLEADDAATQDRTFAKGTTPEQAFVELGGDDPAAPFGAWVVEVTRVLGVARADLVAQIRPTAGAKGRTYRDVRHALKAPLTERLLETLTDPTYLRDRYPAQVAAATSHADLEAKLRALSHVELLAVTRTLGAADKGALAERWYQRVFGRAGDARITFRQADLARAGIDLASDRTPDAVTADGGLREVKHVTGELADRDRRQIDDSLQLVGHRFTNAGKRHDLRHLTVVFTDPKGVVANADWIAERWGETDKPLYIEVFNRRGERLMISRESLADPTFNPGGTAASLAKEIRRWAQ